jgi:hypothetical protein
LSYNTYVHGNVPNEASCIAILNQQKWFLFQKINNSKVKQVLSGDWYQWEGEEYKERMKEAKCSENIMYSCMKMEKLDMLNYFRNGEEEYKGR